MTRLWRRAYHVGTMSDGLHRQWTLLRMIPKAPKKIDSTKIVEMLRDKHGIETTARTVQRDLVNLSRIFPIVRDEETRHFGWSWDKDADLLDLPRMDPQAALTLKLAATFLPKVLPRSTLRFLDPHVKRADEVLREELGGRRHRAWARKVRMVPRGLALVPPKIRPEVLEAVYDALFEERCLEARYVTRREQADKTRVIHPAGLVYRDTLAYLICMVGDHDGIVTLALHRIASAKRLDVRCRLPPGFDLDEYVASGSTGYRYAEAPIRLRARVEQALAGVLEESPVSADQQLTLGEDGVHELSASLPDNWDLRAWLMAQGDALEVLEPEGLREALADMFESAATVYGRGKQRHARKNPVGFIQRAKK